MYEHMAKIVNNMLQGMCSYISRDTVILWLQISYSVYATNYENWLAVDKVIAKISRLTFLAHPISVVFVEFCVFCCGSVFRHKTPNTQTNV